MGAESPFERVGSDEDSEAETDSTEHATQDETTPKDEPAQLGASVQRAPSVSTSGGSDAGPDTSGPTTSQELEAHYGVEIDTPGQAAQLQRLEETNGVETVREWAEEGIPVDAMGTPSKMAAYRQHKETPVPWDIDQRNDQSKRRNELVQRVEQGSPAGETQVPDSVREVVSSPGQSLDPSVKRTMEDRMGEDFSDVQVHTGPKAAQAAESINARAFTVGNHVAFNRGEYDPGSADGQHVIAHELAHVRQQTGGAVSMLPQDDVGLEIDPDPKLEREAEETAQRVMQGSELGIQRLGKTDIHIQRNSYRRQKRQEDGKFGELKEEYSYSAPDNLEKLRNDRPPLPKSVVKEVWNRAKNANGDVICPVDKVKLDWDGENRKGQWVMGHKPRREYRVLVDYLLSGTISYDTFMQEYKNPDHYRPESPQASRRGEHEGRGQYWKEKFGPINTPDADGGIS